MLNVFKSFRKSFDETSLASDMAMVKENSPWHREDNVLVHTDMVIDHYLRTVAVARTPKQQMLTLLTLLFHDTGKPLARVVKFSKERGEYSAFHGHEQRSARLWEDYATENWHQLSIMFNMDEHDFYSIGWMIENHLPMRDAKDKTLYKFAVGLVNMLGVENYQAYFDVLCADQHGRISDDQDKKLSDFASYDQRLRSFADDVCIQQECQEIIDDVPHLFLPIGASGSGKSTWTDNISRELSADSFSLDEERLRFLEEVGKQKIADPIKRYKAAFDYANNKPQDFSKFAEASFLRKVKTRENLIVDNTNTSAKARSKWANVARNHGYQVIGVLFPISRRELLARQISREDKSVPINIVLSQYSNVSFPTLGDDVDHVVVTTTNMLK